MSYRIQRRNPPITETVTYEEIVSPGNVEVDFYVNIYRDKDGNIAQSVHTYTNDIDASACAGRPAQRGAFVGTMKFTATLDDEA